MFCPEEGLFGKGDDLFGGEFFSSSVMNHPHADGERRRELFDPGQDPVGATDGVGGPTLGQEDHEFISLISSDDVTGTDRLFEKRDEVLQTMIASSAPLFLDDFFEMIHIDDDDGEFLIVAVGPREFVSKPFFKKFTAVGLGQGISKGRAGPRFPAPKEMMDLLSRGHQPFDPADKGVERFAILGEEFDRSVMIGLWLELFLRIFRQDDHRCEGLCGRQAVEKVDPPAVRQLGIDDDKIPGALMDLFGGLLKGFCMLDIGVGEGVAELLLDQETMPFVVFDDKDRWR